MIRQFIDRGWAPDCVILGLGVIFGICAVAMPAVPIAIGLVLGVLLVGVAVWDMKLPSEFSVVGQAMAGVALFALPWVGSFAGSSAAWLSWIFATLVVITAAWSWASHSAAQ